MRLELEQATRLLRRTDTESIGEAIRLLQHTVFSFSMKVCGHREDAEDTMQDVLAGALPHLAKIEEPRALAVWLYKVTRNRCLRNRRKENAGNGGPLALEDLMPDDAELSGLLGDNAPDPEQQVLESENHQLVHKAVLQLPPRYRIVLVLHDIEELDAAEVAEVLGLQPGTVRVRLHRARLRVRREMAKLLEPRRMQPPVGDGVRKRRKRPLDCKELFGHLSEYLDGRMALTSCMEMQKHIDSCPACVVFLRDLKRAIDRCRMLKITNNEDVGRSLRRLLTEEYLRLTRSTS